MFGTPLSFSQLTQLPNQLELELIKHFFCEGFVCLGLGSGGGVSKGASELYKGVSQGM